MGCGACRQRPFALVKTDEDIHADAVALATPPTQWIEAYTRYNKEWITVDPVRRRIRCKGIMEPPRASARSGGEGNVLAYVVAFEEGASRPLVSCQHYVRWRGEADRTRVDYAQTDLRTTLRPATPALSPT